MDVGAGTGRHSIFLAKQGFSVTALEQNSQALALLTQEAASAHVSVKTLHGNIQNYKVRGSYDVVIATMLLHFFSRDIMHTIVGKMKILSKSGGLNVVSVLTTKNNNIERSHLFEQNELFHLYDDWRVERYFEGRGRPFRSKLKGKEVRQHIAALIARKP